MCSSQWPDPLRTAFRKHSIKVTPRAKGGENKVAEAFVFCDGIDSCRCCALVDVNKCQGVADQPLVSKTLLWIRTTQLWRCNRRILIVSVPLDSGRQTCFMQSSLEIGS